jgi:hypothetical protein
VRVAALPDLTTAPHPVRLAAAAVFSRAAEVAAGSPALSPEQRTAFADELAGRAGELVRGVEPAWFAAHPVRASVLANDDDFAFVRSRPDCPPVVKPAAKKP